MTNSQLKKYYFPNSNIENNIKKYLPDLINLYGEKTLFENKKLILSERLLLETETIKKQRIIF